MFHQSAIRSTLRLFLAAIAMLVAGYAVGRAELNVSAAGADQSLLARIYAIFGDARVVAGSSLADSPNGTIIHWSRTSVSAPVTASAFDWLILVLAVAALMALVSWRRMERHLPS